jgi:hypothetical protein
VYTEVIYALLDLYVIDFAVNSLQALQATLKQLTALKNASK